MRALDGEAILSIWEAARAAHPLSRAVTLLAACGSRRSWDDAAHTPLGERDAELLQLRAATFGDRIDATIDCPACRQRLELEIRCSTLLAARRPVSASTEIEIDGYSIVARPPAGADLAAAAAGGDVASARAALLDRCVTRADRQGVPVAGSALPADVASRVADALLEADPCAELLFAFACTQCEYRWLAPLDVAHLLWMELAARAQRLLLDVHLLARSYGWRESEILALSSARREAYLALVSA